MDKSWMYSTRRSSRSFVSGVESFLDFAFERSSNSEGNILCPCSRCVNIFHHTRDDVFDHLVCWGFRKGYSVWNIHGECSTTSLSSGRNDEEEEIFDHDMNGLLNDIFHPTPPQQSIGSGPIGEGEVQMSESNLNTGPGESNGRKKFHDLLKDAEEKVYSKSKYSKLSCLVHLYHIKCLNGWSNKSFSMLLDFLRDLLPEGNLLPKTTYQVKKILANLGLSYEKIHACPNGCMLFWGDEDKKKADKCSICNASRWKVAEGNSQAEMSLTKKKASKILRWFPLKPRLQRLFESSKTAALMKWHHEERVQDGKIRHPADALAWKAFDQKFSEFASDPRNVRLALASDGFNPFKTMNVAHSIWPVVLIPYNLPPWLVMKQPNFILSLIIPGPGGPGNKIDVYMQPLIKELIELWKDGVETFDASVKQNFQLKAAIHSTISDFPGYGNLSGWSTKGKLACPSCGFDTDSKWLRHGRKWCYMCHRRWLPIDHRWRSDVRSFVGREEMRLAPVPSTGEEVLRQLEGVEFLTDIDHGERWKKKSIFFKLPYWEHLLLRHNLDVMHIEKNVCDNIIGTLLGQKGKSKDNYNARLEYQAVCEQKRISRSKMEEPHVTGTKSFARLSEEEATKNNGVQPTRGKLYQISRTRKDGSIVNDKAAQVVASIQVGANDSTSTQGIQEDDWTNDDLSKVKGREKRGYVRCVGKMLSLRNNGASSSTRSQTVEQRLAQTEDVLYTLVNLLKDPTANSNISDVIRSLNIEIPDNFSPSQNNSTNRNQESSNHGSSAADQNIGTPTNLS